jgi:hypothetical protein
MGDLWPGRSGTWVVPELRGRGVAGARAETVGEAARAQRVPDKATVGR